MRSTPQFPLETPAADPEKIIRKGKAPREGTSTAIPSVFGNFHNPYLETLVFASHYPVNPSVGVSRILKFGSVPVDFSPPGIGLEGEIFDTHVSLEVVLWFKPRTTKYFITLGFTTPSPIRFVAFIEGETSVPSSPVAFYPNPQLFPLYPRNTFPTSLVQALSLPGSPPVHIPMACANPPRNKMDAIVVARYAPLVFP
jgi:hypothetical protein